ncbi:MAG: PilT/PilU family type 4a pilus ATPase [Gammaproteobacteria bacterium]|jgi:twitching motility protein PilU|nr:PilT/PilU family type 4a pilus ATPase [Gammaproteobacteria bacterium]MBT3725468.1 PilT/PilU family type 4a pilus ATPase [Gammaproteobacteria bacterium]MBT4076658.1 PilT/PilU family type 4a pilus ATPase [Gammaproteobacteria bacterium]MBT4195581.1 PilT/PilU family type 4a pilus ATPase [Gammaproteobacteria bacterium]MBT4448665.1 PilT/PilU family type 4a pilus ATPase [Gammaproteobacteria bacterium]
MSNEPTTKLLEPYLKIMAEKQASDLFFVTGAPPNMKLDGKTSAIAKNPFKPGQVQKLAYSLLSEEQVMDFEINRELNLGFTLMEVGRFRVNIFLQRSEVSMVIRYIKWVIPSLDELGLPPVLKKIAMEKTGLVLVVGSTGSGKSTTLASMLNYRNSIEGGHFLTIEDPIEFVFKHDKAIISQREVGIDTLSYENALREALREAPEVIMIGEARDRETMQAAINFADTGHLCLTTLHAVNSNQAMDRIMNMFPTDMREQLLMDMSLNLKAVVSQRLVPAMGGKLACVVEVMMNSPYISELLREGNFNEIKEVMEKGDTVGMQTFDQSLYDLYKADKITIKNALTYADSSTNLEWKINFGGDQGKDKRHHLDEQPFPDELELPSDE